MDDIRFIRVPKACELLGVTRSTLYRWVQEGRLEAPRKLGASTSGWPYAVLKKFVDEQLGIAE